MTRRTLLCLPLLLTVSWALAQSTTPATPADAPKPRTCFETQYPATSQPDQIILTWAGNPANSISIQWRTSAAVGAGAVAYLPRSLADSFNPAKPFVVKAQTQSILSSTCVNDPFCNHHTARLTRLKPDTEYLYAVGDGSPEGWGQRRAFRTAPVRPAHFSFVYMGDAQYGFERWATLQQAAVRNRPDVAFFTMAGDLVTRGNDRDDWDDLLCHASEIYSRKPVMPAVGNHELKPDGFPVMFMNEFDLPCNGPAEIDAEQVYSFNYGNALYIVLNSNLSPDSQAPWLEQTLANSTAVWKFVMFHHPVYRSDPSKKEHQDQRDIWGPIFDKYHVDVVLTGDEHGYMRTYPMNNQRRVASPAEGTIYLVSVSGTKMYDQEKREYQEVGFTQTQVYSVIDILPAGDKVGDRLVFNTYDLEGNVKDQFTIDKNVPASND